MGPKFILLAPISIIIYIYIFYITFSETFVVLKIRGICWSTYCELAPIYLVNMSYPYCDRTSTLFFLSIHYKWYTIIPLKYCHHNKVKYFNRRFKLFSVPVPKNVGFWQMKRCPYFHPICGYPAIGPLWLGGQEDTNRRIIIRR